MQKLLAHASRQGVPLARTVSSETELQVTAWVTILSVAVAGALQVKAPMLWSTSRILRKIQSTSRPESLLQAVSATSLQEAFSQLYVSLSKGRHRRFSRIYGQLYFLFIVFIDVSDTFLNVNVIYSEALLALRVLIYFGAFAVLGARAFTFVESMVIYGLALGHAGLLLAFGFGWITIAPRTAWTLNTVRVVCIGGLTVLSVIFELCVALKCSGNDIAQIANAIRTKKIVEGTRQAERFNSLQQMCISEPDSTRGKTGGFYWTLSWSDSIDIVLVLILTATNGPAWGKYDSGMVPTTVIIESLEFLSNVLFFFNKTQVEPTLFFELMKLSKTKVLY